MAVRERSHRDRELAPATGAAYLFSHRAWAGVRRLADRPTGRTDGRTDGPAAAAAAAAAAAIFAASGDEDAGAASAAARGTCATHMP